MIRVLADLFINKSFVFLNTSVITLDDATKEVRQAAPYNKLHHGIYHEI